ncbi:hypothetical protein [Bacillus mycoides]|uniref:hypothetical protein n=1 Tax=Bacillus mycoides TaxID=1405 RepID=UPI001F132DAA|nr:hypothetical protein [Bacillus mycoides]
MSEQYQHFIEHLLTSDTYIICLNGEYFFSLRKSMTVPKITGTLGLIRKNHLTWLSITHINMILEQKLEKLKNHFIVRESLMFIMLGNKE